MVSLRLFVESVFGRWTRFIAGHPWKTIFIVVIINTMFGLEFLSLKLNNDIFSLYVAQNTDTSKMRETLLQFFPDRSEERYDPRRSLAQPLYADVIVSGLNDSNVLSDDVVKETDKLVDHIVSINVTNVYERTIDYSSLCAKNNDTCVVKGLLTDDLEYISGVANSNGTIDHALYRKIRFYLRQDSEQMKAESVSWLHRFVDRMETFQSDTIKVLYSHSQAFYEALHTDTIVDIRYFGLAFTFFFTYFGFATSGGDCLSKRSHLARMGMIVVPLSIMGAWGFLCGCGMEFTNVNGVMPFVALCKFIHELFIKHMSLRYF